MKTIKMTAMPYTGSSVQLNQLNGNKPSFAAKKLPAGQKRTLGQMIKEFKQMLNMLKRFKQQLKSGISPINLQFMLLDEFNLKQIKSGNIKNK